MAYATTQTMTKSTTLTLPVPEWPGYRCVPQRGQNILETFGGDLRTADRGVVWYVTEFGILLPRDNAANQDLITLEAFWATEICGALYSFTWVDWRATSHAAARMMEPQLRVTPQGGDLYHVDFRIRTAEMVY